MNLGLISCTKSKQDFPCSTGKMYLPSDLFSKAYTYAFSNYELVGVLSAKYGFLLPEEWIDPYDLTLKTMRRHEIMLWAESVFTQISEKIDLNQVRDVYFHAGVDYRKDLTPMFRARGINVHVPLEGLSFGRQLQWYNHYHELEMLKVSNEDTTNVMSNVKFNLKPVLKKRPNKYRETRKEPDFKLDSSRGISEQIREFANQYYFKPARDEGKTLIEIRAGDLQKRMGYSGTANICRNLRNLPIQNEYKVKLIDETRYGEKVSTSSTTNVFKYDLKPDHVPSINKKKSVSKLVSNDDALQILKQRLAKGEIDAEEYFKLKEIIEKD
jgi:hypothetical protein